MKIAMLHDAVYPFVKGGAEKRMYEIGRRLAKHHDVHIYGMKWWEGAKVIKQEGMTLHGVCSGNLYSRGKRSIISALKFSKCLLAELSTEKFDVIDCYQAPYLHAYAARLAAGGATLILTWHEVWGGKNSYWKKYLGKIGFVGNFIEKNVLKLPKLIIAVSDKTVNDLRDAGVKKKIVMIPNGVDVKRIAKTKPNKESFDVLFVGRLISDKNVDFLLRAISLIKKDAPGIRCGIIGMGPEMCKLKALAKVLHLERNVKFLGFRKTDVDVYSYMKSSKVLAFPSTREGFGIVAVEANACGLPVVTVKHPMNAAADLIDGKNGSVVEFSETAFASGILRIVKDAATRKRMSKHAVAFASNYDWDVVASRVEEVYEKM